MLMQKMAQKLRMGWVLGCAFATLPCVAEPRIVTLPDLRIKFSWEYPGSGITRGLASEVRTPMVLLPVSDVFKREFEFGRIRLEQAQARYHFVPRSFGGSLSWYPQR